MDARRALSLRAPSKFSSPSVVLASLVTLIGALLAVVCVGTGCHASTRSNLATVPMHFELPSGEKTATFTMEVAATTGERRLGLMYRQQLDPLKGMIFLFPSETVQSFWMKNTYISLDMVFVSKDMKVVGILDNVPPLTETPRSVGKPSQYVLEFGAGVMKAHKVVPGAVLVIEGRLPAPL